MARMAVPGLVVGLATTGVVAAATGPASSSSAGSPSTPAVSAPSATPAGPSSAPAREQRTSRDDARPSLEPATSQAKAEAKPKPKPKPEPKVALLPEVRLPSLKVVDTEYTRVDLNVREQADADSDLITVLDSGSKVSVTKTTRGAWQYIAYRGDGGWVKKQYLVESKPEPAGTAKGASAGSTPAKAAGRGDGVSGAACPGGSKVESGLTPDAVRVHRALCARFPGITAYGGVRADSLPQHPSGRALDAMVSNHGLGQEVANWVRANASQLGVSEIIFAQRIWTVQRGSEGWRGMSDRGSATANHHDHVHITVYGNSGR
jgi:hypothetical protein